MRYRSNSTITFSKFFFSSLGAVFFSIIAGLLLSVSLGTTRVSAAPVGVIDTTLPNDGLRMVVAGPSYDFGGNVSRALIYSPQGLDSFTVNFNSTASNASEISAVVVYNYNESIETCGSTVMASNFSVTSSFTLSGSSTNTYLDPQINRRIFCIEITAHVWAGDAPFYLSTSDGRVLLSNDVARSANKTLGTGYVRDDTPSSLDPIWNKDLYFGSPCRSHQNSFPDSVGFFDLDVGNNGSWTQGTIRIRIFDLTGGGTILDETIASNSPNNEELIRNLNFNYSRKYRLLVENLNGVNAIKIALPFSQMDYLLDCTVTSGRAMTCSNLNDLTGAPGTYVQVTYRVTNGSTFNWPGGGHNTTTPPPYNLNTAVVNLANPESRNNRQAALDSTPDTNSRNWVRPSQDGTRNAVYNDGDNTRRYGANGINSNASQDYSVWVQVPASGSRDYGIRMFVRPGSLSTFPFNWMNWDSSCEFKVTAVNPDLCANITGNQTTVPTNYVQVGSNCYRPATCNGNNSFDAWVGESRVFTMRINNNDAYSTLTIEVNYRVGSGSYVDATPSSANIAASGNRTFSTSAVTGSGNIGWQVITRTGSTQVGSTQTCTSTVTRHALPTCSVQSTSVAAGAWSQTSAQLNFSSTYRGGATVNIGGGSTRYRYNDGTNGAPHNAPNTTYGGTLGGSLQGQSTRTGTTYISYNSSTYTASQNSAHSTRVMVPGLYGDVATGPAITWTLDFRDSGFNPSDIFCSSNLSVTIQPLTCIPWTNPFNVGEPDAATVSIRNPNAVPVNVNVSGADRSTFSAPSANPNSGDVVPSVPGTPATSNVDAYNAQRGFETAQDITYSSSGVQQVNWSIRTQYGAAGYSANPAGCSTVIEISRRPYLRTYGNDVVAGSVLIGSDGECTTDDINGVSNIGIRSVSGSRNDYYQGSASELAAIATGRIQNFLPGTGSFLFDGTDVYPQTPLRSNQQITSGYDYLAFGGGGLDIDDVGGDYAAGGLCNEIFPDFSDWNDTGPLFDPGVHFKSRNNDQTIGGQTLSAGTRISIYVDGDVTINNSIVYDTTNWNTSADVPLLRLYASGNIYITGNVSELDGLYVAGGTIETCQDFKNPSLTATQITDSCGNAAGSQRFTLRGAFVADNVIFGRTGGDVSVSNDDPTSDPEIGLSGGNKAERLHFYPEMYVALWDLAGQEADRSSGGNVRFEYISSPPPVF